MRRREFITLLGSTTVAWPLSARAQQPALPVIGFLRDGSAEFSAPYVAGFRKGLNETGYVDGQNVTVEYHWLQLATLTARDKIPATYAVREPVVAGGLMSYGTDLAELFRQMGVYCGRILKGAKPVPPGVLSIADEVIE